LSRKTIFEYTVVAHSVLSSSTQLQHYVLLCQLALSNEKMLWRNKCFLLSGKLDPKLLYPTLLS